MSALPQEAKNPVKAAQTTIEIVETLRDLNGARVTELAEQLDLPKSSVHNYLSTLREEGYVIKRDDEYHVSLQFLELGSFARKQRQIYDVAKPEVRKLAKQTGEHANLMVEENGMGVYLARAKGENAVNVDAYTGHRVTLHNTALGKAILAHLPDERVERILDIHGMPATTAQTITDRDRLFEELERVRDRGVAFDRGERLEGLNCVAAPILNREDSVEGAISVAGPASRITGDKLEAVLPERLRNASNVIELNLTYA